MKVKLAIHYQILLGLFAGVLFSFGVIHTDIPNSFVYDYVKPIGDIFMNALKMVAVPLVLASVITGIASLGDTSKLSRIGGKTIAIFLGTTVIAITIGLLVGNIIKPGKVLPSDIRDELISAYTQDVKGKAEQIKEVKDSPVLQPLVDVVPDNVVFSTSKNSKLLQVVFFAVLVGIALLKLPEKQSAPLINFFTSLNDTIIKIVGIIMFIAPFGVFALTTSLLVDLAGDAPGRIWDLLHALFYYFITVVIGLGLMMLVVYPGLLKMFTKIGYRQFFEAIRPAQLLGFSTSSSNATLPVTMKCVEEDLGIPNQIASFVLPLGSTINMDGTSLYQGVAALFISQAMGLNLGFGDQLILVLTAVMASIGSSGSPGSGLVMMIIVLESIGIPSAGIALILAPDRILDMFRTMVNITGDSAVCSIVSNMEEDQTLNPNTKF